MGLAQRELYPNQTAAVSELPWFAVVVKPRHERIVSDGFLQRGLEGFLPMYWATRRWSDRSMRVQFPLFPGYMFCRCDPRHKLPVLQTPGVRAIVAFGQKLVPVPDGEIERIQQMLASGSPLEPWPFLSVGQRVRVDDGPLSGLEGILSEVRGTRRVIVSLELLQRSVAANLDRAHITPL